MRWSEKWSTLDLSIAFDPVDGPTGSICVANPAAKGSYSTSVGPLGNLVGFNQPEPTPRNPKNVAC